MECHNEEAQCAFVADKILEIASDGQNADCSFGNVAILYRRQVSICVTLHLKFVPFNCICYSVSCRFLVEHFRCAFATGKYPLILMGWPFIGKRFMLVLQFPMLLPFNAFYLACVGCALVYVALVLHLVIASPVMRHIAGK